MCVVRGERLSVSVIIPTYNRAELLRAAVESALCQTRPPEEVIVVDDGSTDETAEILAEYDAPVRVIYQENRGRSHARNVGLAAATGDLIVFLDSDDTLVPTSIERRAEVFEKDADVEVVYGDMIVIDEEGARLGVTTEFMRGPRPSGYVLGELAVRNFVLMPAMVLRRAVGCQRFDESLSRSEDYDFWRRLAPTCRFRYIDEPIACYRVHDANTIVTQPRAMLESEVDVQGRILAMGEFRRLARKEQARAHRLHGVKQAALGNKRLARQHFGIALWLWPFAALGGALYIASLIAPNLLSQLICARRRSRKNIVSAVKQHRPGESDKVCVNNRMAVNG